MLPHAININQDWYTMIRITDIYINDNWNKFWNMDLYDNIRKQMLRDNYVV
jgi:hypothetical protein